MYKIIIVDDDIEIKEILIKHFASSSNVECSFHTDSTERLLKFNFDNTKIDLILLDINLPYKSGVDSVSAICKKFPNSEIIMYTVVDDNDKIFQAICNGATGYLLKNQTPNELEQQLISVLRDGGSLISPQIAKRIINYFHPSRKSQNQISMSETEEQMMQFLIDGLSYKEIAAKLGLSTHGVRYHILNIYRKMEVNSKQQAIKKYSFFSKD
jgi:DNA-binding NarL/FixJ family response regulator